MINKKILIFLCGIILFAELISAGLIVNSNYAIIFPGESSKINLRVENNLGYDLEDVSVQIVLTGTFSTIGSSQKKEDIDDDDSEDFNFELRASSSTIPGDYNIPYLIIYESKNGTKIQQQGTFGLRVSAKTELEFGVDSINAIVGERGKVSFKILNRGLSEIKFINIQIVSRGFDVFGSKEQYIGSIDSDDTDSATFDVLFNSKTASLTANVYYKDFENNNQVKTVTYPIKVYTKEEALKLGLINKNYTWVYLFVVAFLVLFWFIYRSWKKARKKKLNGELRR